MKKLVFNSKTPKHLQLTTFYYVDDFNGSLEYEQQKKLK